MTSTNDGKDVKSNQTSGSKGKTYYIELYKSLEASLSSDCELRERTQHLSEAWRRIHSLCQHSAPSTHPHLLSWLQRHTARLVLQTEWQSPKSKDGHKSLEDAISAFIKECENRSGSSRDAGPPPWETQLVARGEWFKKILGNPWGHPVLRVLLDPRGEPPSDEEVLEWLKEERGVMFMTRLRQLTASKCDDLALSLSSAVMDRVRACATPPADTDTEPSADVKDKPKAEKKPTFEDILKTEAGFTQDVWELLIDMEFVLLHKGDKRSRCIELAKQTPLRNGYQLVERLQSRLETSPREKKLWKNAKEVATLIAQVVITRCMVVPQCAGAGRTALYCCARSLVRALGPRLPDAARALAAPAATARHLHTLAAAVEAQSKEEMKPFVCELYVRAITAGMNELERLKHKTEKEAEARSAEQTLASWFTQLGLILSASERIRCECTLTAFSVHPTPAMFERIKCAPQLPPLKLDDLEIQEEPNKEFGSWASDSRGQTNFVKTSETLNLKHTQHQANVLSTAIFSEGEVLGISPELCTDIAVLLSGPRLKTLSWDTDRELLLENCRTYMERTNFGTRALTTELKYLNLDPREFQHLPEEEDDESDKYYGIEKGYEHHLEEYQEPEEIWQDADDPERTESAHSTDMESEAPVKSKKSQRKSKKIHSSEDDSDPLSLVAEAKRVEKKKERPHSKERSKEPSKEKSKEPKKSKSKAKPKDRLEINDQSTEKKKREPKKKRESKKKEKLAVPLPKSSLSNLIGMRVANERKQVPLLPSVVSTPSLSDVSDLDSQGKSSINSNPSENNETDVLYDGLFSMDEIKSPEKAPDKNTLTRNSEFHITNGKVGASTSLVHYNTSPSGNDAVKHQVPNSPKSRTSSPSNMLVKESLSKLLHYRRQKAFENEQRLNLQPNVLHTCSYKPGVDTPTITPASSPVPVTPISSPQLKVNIPENPKVYINKTQSEQLTELRNEVNNLLSTKTFGIARPVIQYCPKTNWTNNNSPNNSQITANRFPSPSLQKQMQEIYKPQTQVKSTGTEPKATSSRFNSPNRQKSGDSASQQSFHTFLKELQESINAGAGSHSSISIKKEIKPISRVTPVVPTIKAEPNTSPQSAKQTQKKSSDFLNTFSRLSYLHKNKVDSKGNGTKPVVDALIEYQSKTLQNPPTDAEIERILKEQKIANANFIQTTNEVTKSPASKGRSAYQQPESSQNLLKKFDKTVSNTAKHATYTVQQNPIIANILSSAKKPAQPEIVYKNVQTERQREMSAASSKSSLTERDQQDIVALLRQKTKLNYGPKVENVIEKVQVPHTITCHIPSTNYSVRCTSQSQSSSKHKILDAPNIVYNNGNNKHLTIPSPSIKPSKDNLEIRMPQTKPLNMVKTELNCTKTVNQKPAKKIEILSNIEIKSGFKHEPAITEEPKEETDWEKVMDEILSHKTPSRGPKALDMALNKDACKKKVAKSQQNLRNLRDISTEDLIKMTKVISKGQSKPALTADPINIPHPPVLSRSYTESVIKTSKKSSKTPAKVVQTPLTNSSVHANLNVTKSIQPETPKRPNQTKKRQSHEMKDQQDVLKKLPLKPHVKQFTAQYFKEEDPFISGIPNSDYDLLEELMDDDLRQEIGELSSDEDNYRAPIQGLKDKNYSINKHTSAIQEEKRLKSIVTKNEPIHKKSVSKSRPEISKTAFDSSVLKQQTSSFLSVVGKTVIKTPEIVKKEAKNVQPTHAVHQMPQTVITPTKNKNNQCSRANTGQARTIDQIQTFVTSVSQQTALNNVVLIGSDIVYQPCTVQTSTGIATNVMQNTYVTYNDQQNMALYQTTQFAAPVVNPLIIGNAITVSKTTLPTVSNKQEIGNDGVQQKTINHETKDTKSESKTNSVDDPNDINSNKNICERKVLSEVQEKQKITTEKIEPKNTRSQARKSFERDAMNEVIKDQERLQKKRLSILNRNICHRSDEKAIPLTYAPLKPIKIILKIPKVPQRKHEQASGTRNGIKKQSRTSNTAAESIEAKVINPDKTKSTENYKENKEKSQSSRRILLRSSNKDVKLDTEVIEKVSIPRKTKVRLKTSHTETANKTLESFTDEDSLNKLKVVKKTVTKKTLNKTIKKVEIKKKATKIQPKRNAKVVKITTDRKPELKPLEEVIPNEMTDLMDIEDEIITSKILEVMSPDQPILPLQEIPNVEEILGDIEENRTNVSTYDNRLSPSILDNDDSLNQLLETANIDKSINDATVYAEVNVNKSNDDVLNKDVDATPEITETVHKPVATDTNENNIVKQNETNTDIVEEIESYVKKLEDNLKDTANNQRLDLECNEIMFNSAEVNKISCSLPEMKTTEVITPVDSAKQNAIDPKINNNKAKDQENSKHKEDDIICIDEDDEEPNNDKNKEPLKKNNVPMNEGKTYRQKRKNTPKTEMSQSYQDAIRFEEIELPRLHPGDPMKKTVRIKLPCGKVFKATVRSHNGDVDTKSIFSDPTLKNHILKNLASRQRYTLNFKHNNEPKTDSAPEWIPVKTELRTQEIRLVTPVETIDLLSDSDEETQHQSFKTEFGKYQTQTMEKMLLEKHQYFFDKKCVVKLKSEDLQKYLNISQKEHAIETSVENYLPNESLPVISLQNEELAKNTEEPAKNTEELANNTVEPAMNIEEAAVETVQPIIDPVVEPISQHADTVIQPTGQPGGQTDIETEIEPVIQSSIRPVIELNNKLASQPVEEPVALYDRPSIIQLNHQCRIQQDVPTDDQTINQPDKIHVIQPVIESVILSDLQPIVQSELQPEVESNRQSVIQPVTRPDVQPEIEPDISLNEADVGSLTQFNVQPVPQPSVQPMTEFEELYIIQSNIQPVIQAAEPMISPVVKSVVEEVAVPVAQPDVQQKYKPFNHLIGIESVQTEPKQKIVEIIEIDDSSNDCADLIDVDRSDEENNIFGLMERLNEPTILKDKTAELLKPYQRTSPVPMEAKINEFKNLLFKDLGIEDLIEKSTISNDCSLTFDSAPCVINVGNSVSCDSAPQIPTLPDCVVKLARCDELVRKYEDLKLLKDCFIKLVRCDELVQSYADAAEQSDDIIDIQDSVLEEIAMDVVPLSRCGSFSILDNCDLIDVLQTVDQIERNNSPVMEAYGTIASFCSRKKVATHLRHRESLIQDHRSIESYNAANMCEDLIPNANNVMPLKFLVLRLLNNKIQLQHMNSRIQDHSSIESCNTENTCAILKPNRNNVMPLKSLVLKFFHDHSSINQINAARQKTNRHIISSKPNRKRKSLETCVTNNSKITKTCENSSLKRSKNTNKQFQTEEISVNVTEPIEKTNEDCVNAHEKSMEVSRDFSESASCGNSILELDSRTSCLDASEDEISASVLLQADSVQTEFYIDNDKTQFLTSGVSKATELGTENFEDDTISEIENNCMVVDEIHIFEDTDSKSEMEILDAVDVPTESNINTENTPDVTEDIKNINQADDTSLEVVIITEDISSREVPQLVPESITNQDCENIGENNDTILKDDEVALEKKSQDTQMEAAEKVMEMNCGNAETVLKKLQATVIKMCDEVDTKQHETEIVMEAICDDADKVEPETLTVNICEYVSTTLIDTKMEADNNLTEPKTVMCDANTILADSEMLTEIICENTGAILVRTKTVTEVELKLDEPEMPKKNVCDYFKIITTEIEQGANTNLVKPKIAEPEMSKKIVYEAADTGIETTDKESDSSLEQPGMIVEHIYKEIDTVLVDTETEMEVDVKIYEPEMTMEGVYGIIDTQLTEPEMSSENVCQEIEIETTVIDEEAETKLKEVDLDQDICDNCDTIMSESNMTTETLFGDNNEVLVDTEIKNKSETTLDETEGVLKDTQLSKSKIPTENLCLDVDTNKRETTEFEYEGYKNVEEQKNVSSNNATTLVEPEMTTENICEENVALLAKFEKEDGSETTLGKPEAVIADTQPSEPEIPTDNDCDVADTNMETKDNEDEANTNLKEKNIVSTTNADITTEPEITTENICGHTEAAVVDTEIKNESETTRDEPKVVTKDAQVTEPEMTDNVCDIADTNMEMTDIVYKANTNLEEEEIVSTSNADTTTTEPEVTTENICEHTEASVIDTEIENVSESTRDEPVAIIEDAQLTESRISADNVCGAVDMNMEITGIQDESDINLEEHEIVSCNNADTTTVDPEVRKEHICEETDTVLLDSDIESETTLDETKVVMENRESERSTEKVCEDTDINMDPTGTVDEAYTNLEEQEIDSLNNTDTITVNSDITIENICDETDTVLRDSEIESETILDETEVVVEDTQLTEVEMRTENVSDDADANMKITEIVNETSTNLEEQEIVGCNNADATTADPEMTAESIYELTVTIKVTDALLDSEIESETTLDETEPHLVIAGTQLTKSEMATEYVCDVADTNMETTDSVGKVNTNLEEQEIVSTRSDTNMETTAIMNEDFKEDSNLSEEYVIEVNCEYAHEKLVLPVIKKQANTKLKQPKIVMEDICENAIATLEDICAEGGPKLVETFIEIGTSQDEPEELFEVDCKYAEDKLVLPVIKRDANSKLKELETVNESKNKATNIEVVELEMALASTSKDINPKRDKSEGKEIEINTQMESSKNFSKVFEDANTMRATEREKEDETYLEECGFKKEAYTQLMATEKEKALENIREDVHTESQECSTDLVEHNDDDLDKKFKEIETKLKSMFEDTDSMLEETGIAIENYTKEHDAILDETHMENMCKNVNETIDNLDTIECKEDNDFDVDTTNDNCLVEEIVDMHSDEILDDETAQTVLTNALTQVNKSSIHTNEELTELKSQEVMLLDTRDKSIRTLKHNVLLGAHASSLLIDCDAQKYPEENILITQQIGEDGRIQEIDIKLNFPKITYSKKYPSGLVFDCLFSDTKNRKRKIDMTDVKIITKKYRKGKNIDFPKITSATIGESGYAKEFKQLMDYCSSVKFSYSRPFHKEYIDVQETLQEWPIKGICNVEQSETENDETLFTDAEDGVNIIHDPSIQTLAEEINSNNELNYEFSNIIETNFNMGFGEGSGRVIQNLEDVCGIKFSAATLSDVKQTQPLLLSENYVNCKRVHKTINFTNKYEIEKIQSNIRCIEMKNKVRSFFKKTMNELSYDLIKQQEKDDMCSNRLFDSSDFPLGLTDPDFVQPAPFEAIVQVVQVGQLPVSAAAQNPVTCDPRVTQVSNVSPSQCTAENSPDDDQSVIKTEYTELTTADLRIPLEQEYVQHIQSMPMPPHGHEVMNYPMGSNYSVDIDIKPEIKTEMEDIPEIKEEINDNYENSEYPPLFEKNMMNSVDYSHITPLEPNSNVTMVYNYTDKHSVPEAYPNLKQQEHLHMQQQLHQQQQQQEQCQQQHEQEQYQQQQEPEQYHQQQQNEQYQQQQKIMQQQQQLEQEQQQLQQQQEYQQRQMELQQMQLEQEKQKRLELEQLQIKQQQEEQKQLRLEELKRQQELKQQKEHEEEMQKHQHRLLELKRAQDLKQQQQQLQQELRQQKQQELKQQKQRELKQQQQKQKELKLQQQLEQKELKQQQQKQKELKQQQLLEQKELKQQQQLELKQQKQQELKQKQQKQQELKQQQLAQLKQQKQQELELKQQQLKQQKQQQLQQKQMQRQQERQKQRQLQQQELQQKQQLQQIELQQKQQAQQQQELQQKQQMQQQQELQEKQQMQQQHELQQKQQIQQQQQELQQQQQQQELQQQQQQNGTREKTDQIAHAMNAAGISSDTETRTQALVNMISQKLRQGNVTTGQSANNFQKTTTINAMALQQALAQILPPPLNPTNVSESNQQATNTHSPQVLHIVQGKSASGNHQQITLVDNTQQSVINAPNSTPVLHIVQNKTVPPGPASNGTPQQTNSFSGLSLVDGGLQQGNQLLHIVNAGNQKNANTGQLLKRVNLLTNLTNAQGGNEQKMVQFVCKSADGKSIQLNGPHQRSMVLRLQPVETPNLQPTQPKQQDAQEMSPTHSANRDKDAEIKSRSIYEENYAKFIQTASPKPAGSEKGTSLPKFNQAFGKQMYQDGGQKNEISNGNEMSPDENQDCQANDNAMNLDPISQIGSPPLLLRKPSTSQAQPNLVQQIKQTISPMNLHGGVIYTRQIPVNLGGGQTINLITVPSSELGDEANQKQQVEIEPSIIKIVPQTQTHSNTDGSDESNTHMVASNDNAHTPQPQQVLTQMRIKLPMLSKAPQMVSGGRVVRPSFFQIQRNVISGTNQPVYQQLVLTAAPQLGQQTIRLPQAQTPQTSTSASSRPAAVKATPSESQSSTESICSSTLEQLREFDLVLEQVKERSTVQPPKSRSRKKKEKAAEAAASTSTAAAEPSRSTPAPHKQHQVLYSIGNTQPLNVAAYVNRKGAATPAPASTSTPTTSTFVRSPDSSGIVDSSPSSSSQIPHTVTSEPSTSSETPAQSKKSSSKSKSRPKASSNPPNTLKLNTTPPKPSTQKPAEDEQTTQRILYILAEYKEQVENSPDKDKPAPRRRTNPPSAPGSSKRKKHRRNRDLSPTDESCRGSEDSSCGTSQGDCNESCIDSHSPQDSPRKVVRKLTFEHDTSAQSAPPTPQPRPQPQQRNVIVADGQTITVARGTAGKQSTAVLMPANYILPVSMIKGGQQIAIVTNRGPKLITVAGGDGGATNALLLQRLIGPAGLKPVLTRPGVRHVRLPTAALHNLQAFNLATATTIQPPDSTASPAPAPAPPELIETRANSSPWRTESREEVKPERGSSPEGEPWHLPATANPHDYSYEEVVRTDMERTVLVVQKKDGSHHRRLTHVSAAALRHKYAILEHELRLQEYLSQKSLSEECEDLGVDSPSASELFPEAELLFAASPTHDHNTQDHGHHSHTPQPLLQHGIPQPDIDDQIATDQLLQRTDIHDDTDLGIGLEDVGIVTVSEDGMQATIQLDQEEFARSHPNTTFHSEPTDEGGIAQPFTLGGLKGRQITSTIYHANRAPGTVLMTAPQTTVISQATAETSGVHNTVKYADIDNMIDALPGPTHNNNINLSSVLVKDDGLTRFDTILNDNRELHLSNTASHIVHATGNNTTQVIRRVCYGNKREQASRFLMDESDIMANHHTKMMEDSRDFGDADDDGSSPERAELFWESSQSERETRRPLDFSSDSDKCCKSPSFEENNSTDSSGLGGAHMRLDSVIKDARGIERRCSADGSSADDNHAPPLRTYPPKRMYHAVDAQRSLSGKTRAPERIDVRDMPGRHHAPVRHHAIERHHVPERHHAPERHHVPERHHTPVRHHATERQQAPERHHTPERHDNGEGRRRASGRGVVKRGCLCCNGEPAPPRPKKPRQRKPNIDFTAN